MLAQGKSSKNNAQQNRTVRQAANGTAFLFNTSHTFLRFTQDSPEDTVTTRKFRERQMAKVKRESCEDGFSPSHGV